MSTSTRRTRCLGGLTGFRIINGGDAEDGEYCTGCGWMKRQSEWTHRRECAGDTYCRTSVHRREVAASSGLGERLLQLQGERQIYYTPSRLQRMESKHTFAWLSALRCASIEWCRERPSMLLAWGREEREHASDGRATRDSGGMDFVEDAEESDFCVWDGIGAWCGRLSRWSRGSGTRLRVRNGREMCPLSATRMEEWLVARRGEERMG